MKPSTAIDFSEMNASNWYRPEFGITIGTIICFKVTTDDYTADLIGKVTQAIQAGEITAHVTVSKVEQIQAHHKRPTTFPKVGDRMFVGPEMIVDIKNSEDI